MRMLPSAFGLALLATGLASAPLAQPARFVAVVPPDTTVLHRVEAAFRAGDAAALLADAAEPLDLAIYGQGASYTRSQAALVLHDFFRRYPPEEVRLEEEVVSEDRRSLVGHYREAGALQPAAVFVRLRARDGRWEIRSIRIERARR